MWKNVQEGLYYQDSANSEKGANIIVLDCNLAALKIL
jgi:hypothetical protein